MVKAVFKEVTIFLLLLLAIILILGILFYSYIPNNKTVPIALNEYKLSEEAKAELEETLSQTSENIVKTYYIGQEDLSLYESTKDYSKSKRNPFQDYTTNESITNQNSNSTNTNKTNSNTDKNTVNNSGTSKDNEVFFPGGKNQ